MQTSVDPALCQHLHSLSISVQTLFQAQGRQLGFSALFLNLKSQFLHQAKQA